jgi:hypothetical protein
MRRRVFAILVGVLLAICTVGSTMAAPVICPGNTYPAHDQGDWYCAAGPNDNETGAGWHRGTNDKL